MNAKRAGMILLILFGIGRWAHAEASRWQQWPGATREQSQRLIVLPDGDRGAMVLAGTERGVYVLDSGGAGREAVMAGTDGRMSVNGFAASLISADQVWAATDNGVFASQDRGRTWKKIFDGAGPGARNCLSVVFDDNSQQLYAGTTRGLYVMAGGTGVFQRVRGQWDDRPVTRLAQDRDYIFLATDTGVHRFSKDNPNEQKRIFFSYGEEPLLIIDEAEEFSRRDFSIKDLTVVVEPASAVLAASIKGVFISRDRGQTWQGLPLSGLPQNDVNKLAAVPSGISETGFAWTGMGAQSAASGLDVFAATSRGVFALRGDSWTPLYQGMETNRVNDLAMVPGRGGWLLYAATDNGVYCLIKEGHQEEVPDYALEDAFADEPTVRDVQLMVIAYADVGRDKIETWKRQARIKAFLPSVSAGLNRSATELFHWNTGSNPDELQKGRDYLDWGLSASWDLADLVWSTDQTSIDSRSKMMVELREDLLDQVTRIYFERRRLQWDMRQIRGSGGGVLQERNDKWMRISELTALIDAMTGGAFSKAKNDRDELESREDKQSVSFVPTEDAAGHERHDDDRVCEEVSNGEGRI